MSSDRFSYKHNKDELNPSTLINQMSRAPFQREKEKNILGKKRQILKGRLKEKKYKRIKDRNIQRK